VCAAAHVVGADAGGVEAEVDPVLRAVCATELVEDAGAVVADELLDEDGEGGAVAHVVGADVGGAGAVEVADVQLIGGVDPPAWLKVPGPNSPTASSKVTRREAEWAAEGVGSGDPVAAPM